MNIKIFTDNIEGQALNQVYTIAKMPAFENAKIRIMPDVHAGAGCVIGFTADLGDKVIPNIVGVDIGCGMLTVKLKNKNLDTVSLADIDDTIHKFVPSGHDIHDSIKASFNKIKDIRCYEQLKNKEIFECSIGSLGGGNHFIEIDQDENGTNYLIIHTGSRNLGKQVAEYYQKLAFRTMTSNHVKERIDETIAKLKAEGKERDIENTIKILKMQTTSVPKELCWLEGQNRNDYLHDMKICQEYAVLNRATIADIILSHTELIEDSRFETIHNYIDHDSNIVRKGSIRALKGERVLIPLNMRDGCIIGIGKGNEDWNYSAPHGAGRTLSRSQAKEMINMDDYKESMKDIFTTSVNQSTIDESPFAYKPSEEIIELVKDTVDIEKIIKPIYNFKASE